MSKTFVYLCRPGENEELRYSLRSIAKFYPEATVWVIGGKPDWYDGNFIEVAQGRDVFKNVKSALAKAIDCQDIPEDFIVMNDDFFFVRYVEDIKFYVSGSLKDKIDINRENKVTSPYIRKLGELYRHCRKYNPSPLDFELHVPMPVNKQNLSQILNDLVMWRSNYGNRFAKDSDIEVMQDVKVYASQKYFFKTYDYSKLKYPFISTHDDSFKKVFKDVFRDMFPYPSKYESIPIPSSSQSN